MAKHCSCESSHALTCCFTARPLVDDPLVVHARQAERICMDQMQQAVPSLCD